MLKVAEKILCSYGTLDMISFVPSLVNKLVSELLLNKTERPPLHYGCSFLHLVLTSSVISLGIYKWGGKAGKRPRAGIVFLHLHQLDSCYLTVISHSCRPIFLSAACAMVSVVLLGQPVFRPSIPSVAVTGPRRRPCPSGRPDPSWGETSLLFGRTSSCDDPAFYQSSSVHIFNGEFCSSCFTFCEGVRVTLEVAPTGHHF